MTTVNTGRRVFEVREGQLWKSLDPREGGRVVLVDKVDRLRVHLSNWKTKRKSKKYLQDFVLVFELMVPEVYTGLEK